MCVCLPLHLCVYLLYHTQRCKYLDRKMLLIFNGPNMAPYMFLMCIFGTYMGPLNISSIFDPNICTIGCVDVCVVVQGSIPVTSM